EATGLLEFSLLLLVLSVSISVNWDMSQVNESEGSDEVLSIKPRVN
ncbi:28152_t:CDS:2, partial [Racocetra persica]